MYNKMVMRILEVVKILIGGRVRELAESEAQPHVLHHLNQGVFWLQMLEAMLISGHYCVLTQDHRAAD